MTGLELSERNLLEQGITQLMDLLGKGWRLRLQEDETGHCCIKRSAYPTWSTCLLRSPSAGLQMPDLSRFSHVSKGRAPRFGGRLGRPSPQCNSAGSSGRKTDSHDARAVAIAALHAVGLTVVAAENHSQVLRLLSQRRAQLSATRTQTVARLHNLLAELLPGGAKRQLSADTAGKVLRQVRPATAVDECRRELARELLEDLRRLDRKLAENKTRIEAAAAMSGTTLPEVQGIGPVTAARILGQVGDVSRFADRAHFAAYAGAAPIEASSGAIQRHRLSRNGNRQLNSALHTVAITQIAHPGAGRELYQRKLAAGKTAGEARRALKRHLANVIYARLVDDNQRGVSGPGRTHEGDSAIQRG
jgi:transposase